MEKNQINLFSLRRMTGMSDFELLESIIHLGLTIPEVEKVYSKIGRLPDEDDARFINKHGYEEWNKMIDIEIQSEFQTLSERPYRSGYLVTTKTGLIGRTYHDEKLINSKMRVYTNSGKLLCNPNSLKVTGYID